MAIFRSLLVCSVLLLADALFFTLPAKSSECFGVKITSTISKFSGSFDISGASEGSRASLTDQTGQVVWSSAESAGQIELKTPTVGTYKLCFDSTVGKPQVVSFDLHVSSDYDYDPDASNLATKAHTSEVDKLSMKLYEKVQSIEDQQHHSITREEVHRNAAIATSDQVAWWSIAKILVLTGCSFAQVWYLKSFFETKQII